MAMVTERSLRAFVRNEFARHRISILWLSCQKGGLNREAAITLSCTLLRRIAVPERLFCEMTKSYLEMEDGMGGALESANSAFELIQSSVTEHIQSEAANAEQQEALYEETLGVRAESAKACCTPPLLDLCGPHQYNFPSQRQRRVPFLRSQICIPLRQPAAHQVLPSMIGFFFLRI